MTGSTGSTAEGECRRVEPAVAGVESPAMPRNAADSLGVKSDVSMWWQQLPVRVPADRQGGPRTNDVGGWSRVNCRNDKREY